MLQLTINEKGGPSRTESFDKEEVTIGRVQGNDIILPKGNISKRHSRIVLKEGKFVIVDLKSTNGTYVNGKKIAGPQVIKSTDKVYIGDFTLQIDHGQNGAQELGLGARPGEEIDLFGGSAAPFEAGSASNATPGLLESNFDADFEAPVSDPREARLPRASKRNLSEDVNDAVSAEAALFGAEAVSPGPTPNALPVEEELARGPTSSALADAMEVGATSLPGPAESALGPSAANGAVGRVSDALTSVPEPESMGAVLSPRPLAEALPLEDVVLRIQRMVASSLRLEEQPLSILTELRAGAQRAAEQAWAQLAMPVPVGTTETQIIDMVVARLVGVEPLVDVLVDDSVFEVVVTADRRVLVDREGRLEDSGRSMGSDAEIVGAIHTLALMGGMEPGELSPTVDTRLRSGDRLIASLPPFAFRGPVLSVRKTTRDFFTLEKLQEYDTINGALVPLLESAVRFRQNILLSTGPGVSATATLNALLSQMPADERVVTAENGVELHLRGHVHAVAFDLSQELSVEAVLRHAVVSQTDRVIVAEVGETSAAPVVEAFRSHLEGSAIAVPAATPESALEQLSEWVTASTERTLAEAQKRVAEAFGLVVQERRLSDGSRRITQVAEIVAEEGQVELHPLVTFRPSGTDENQMVTGTFVASGRVPTFLKILVEQGEVDLDLSVYKNG